MPTGTPPLSAAIFEQRLDEALLVDSGSVQPCPTSVRTLLEVLQQQPFLPAYAASASPEASEIREHLLELPSAQQTRVLVKIFRVSSKRASRTEAQPIWYFFCVVFAPPSQSYLHMR